MLGNPSTEKKEVPVNYRNLLHRIVVIPLVIAVSALLGCGETIEIDRASFSGRVVDEAENPIAELALVIIPCKVDDDTLIAVYDAETNDTGHFSITGIYPGKAQFMRFLKTDMCLHLLCVFREPLTPFHNGFFKC